MYDCASTTYQWLLTPEVRCSFTPHNFFLLDSSLLSTNLGTESEAIQSQACISKCQPQFILGIYISVFTWIKHMKSLFA